MVRAVGENSFHQDWASRPVMVWSHNPLKVLPRSMGRLRVNSNRYYRRVGQKSHVIFLTENTEGVLFFIHNMLPISYLTDVLLTPLVFINKHRTIETM